MYIVNKFLIINLYFNYCFKVKLIKTRLRSTIVEEKLESLLMLIMQNAIYYIIYYYYIIV
jgi:hypothetical protein